MAIYKGSSQIVGLYIGNTEILKRYKGTDLIYEAFSWEQWYQTFLYNALIPQTINSKNVLNQAKVVEVEGNGVVENQLNNHATRTYTNDNPSNYTDTKTNTGVDLVCTTAGTLTNKILTSVDLILGHKYIFVYDILSTLSFNLDTTNTVSGNNRVFNVSSISANQPTKVITLFDANESPVSWRIARGSTSWTVGATMNITNIMIFDLTLMFGTGNEPTTLTDTRIQALLNRNYIAYNTGAIKDTNVSEIEFAPYNLFDEVLELGYLNVSGGYVSSNTDILSKNFQSVIPNRTYNLNADNFTHTSCFICEYDENQTYIANTRRNITSSHSFTASSQTRYVKFCFYSGGTTYSEVPTNTQVYLALQGTRTGYAPHKSPSTISLPNTLQLSGAINSHNTFEITNSGYVFTRNVWKYTFTGSESFSIGGATTSGLYRYYTTILNNSMSSGTAQDGLCDKYAVDKGSYNAATTPCVRFGQSNSAIYFYLTQDYSQSSDVASAVNGTSIYYPLATPQTITIPKAHLGCVDLGSLSWTYYSATGVFWATVSDIKVQTPNLICSKYLTQGYISSSANLQNGYIGTNMWTGNGNQIIVKDSSYSNATDFKTAMSGVYLFYETENEVADIDTKIGIEAGGTITSNWFSWKKNQIVANGNFVDFSNWATSGGSTVYSYANNILTFKAVQRYGGVRQTLDIVASHKYLFTWNIKMGTTPATIGTSVVATLTNVSPQESRAALNTNWQKLSLITTANSGQTQSVLYIRDFAESNWGDNQVKDVMVFDLTLAFGSGNEPTDISDPRIQYIINNGYIPTDTTGTDTLVDSQVLPNIDLRLKSK